MYVLPFGGSPLLRSIRALRIHQVHSGSRAFCSEDRTTAWGLGESSADGWPRMAGVGTYDIYTITIHCLYLYTAFVCIYILSISIYCLYAYLIYLNLFLYLYLHTVYICIAIYVYLYLHFYVCPCLCSYIYIYPKESPLKGPQPLE